MRKTRSKPLIKHILIGIGFAAVITVIIMRFFITAFRIEGTSMIPMLNPNDRVIISKSFLKGDHIKRFDIVVLYKPNDQRTSIVKRVVGLPGETIRIYQGEVFINREKISFPPNQVNLQHQIKEIQQDTLLIPPNHCFVMGDNFTVSNDSRNFGTVPMNRIRGKVVYRYWPPSKAGKIK